MIIQQLLRNKWLRLWLSTKQLHAINRKHSPRKHCDFVIIESFYIVFLLTIEIDSVLVELIYMQLDFVHASVFNVSVINDVVFLYGVSIRCRSGLNMNKPLAFISSLFRLCCFVRLCSFFSKLV